MHSHYTLTNQRAKDAVLAVAQPIVHGINIQHRGISISKDFSTVSMFHCCGLLNTYLDGEFNHAIELTKLRILVEHVIS